LDVEHHWLRALPRLQLSRDGAHECACGDRPSAVGFAGKAFRGPVLWRCSVGVRGMPCGRCGSSTRHTRAGRRIGAQSRRAGGLYGAQDPALPARSPRYPPRGTDRGARRSLCRGPRDRRLAGRPRRRATPEHECRRRSRTLRRAGAASTDVRRGTPIPPDSVMALRAFAAKVALPWPPASAKHGDLGVSRNISSGRASRSCAPTSDRGRDHACQEDLCAGRGLPRRRTAARGTVRPGRGGRARPARHVRAQLGAPRACAADEPRFTDLVDRVIEVRDGYLIAPDRPGIGMDLVDAGLARHPPVSVDLSDPPLREDGSVAIR